MAFKRIAVILSLGCVLFVTSEPASGAGTKQAKRSDPALATVEKVLRAEVAGEVDRRRQLAEALEQHPDWAAVRWQAGFVKDGDSWRSFDEPQPNPAAKALLGDYRRRRDEAPQSFTGHMDMANWCRKQALKDQERTHLAVALSLAPAGEQPRLLKRLGYVQIGDQWVSEVQRRDWQNAIRQTENSLKKWSAKLERIAQRLAGNNVQHKMALAELRGAVDVSAIPAIELLLTGRDEELAHVAVDTLRMIEGPEASVALARQAVFSQWPEIRKSASAFLKERRFEDFVPALIALLVVPAEGRFCVLYDPYFYIGGYVGAGRGLAGARGALIYSYVVALETENQFQVATFNMVSPVIVSGPSAPSGALERDIILGIDTSASQNAARNALNTQNYQREKMNDRIEELNGRLIAVLSELARSEPSPDVRKWWQWWSDFTDMNGTGSKPVASVYETEAAPPAQVYVIRKNSCFAAGTPVWTESGAQAIETIKVGDRVLAKDVETGELAYQPVLQTSVRPPKELTTLRFGDETIVCTGGHRFWSSGTGWIKARDLQPLTMLHTVIGNTPVWSAKMGDTAQTYNLVVADFHTYFVGKTGVLCQDLLIPGGTNNVVPGLARK